METVSLLPKEEAIENAGVIIIDSQINLTEEIKSFYGDCFLDLDSWLNDTKLKIKILIDKADIIRGLALGSHLKNFYPIICHYYSDLFQDKDLRDEVENILEAINKVFIGHYPDAKEAKEAGSRVFHFMLALINKGKDLKKENIKAKCVVNGCCETAINSHTISRAHNFCRGVNYYSLKARIRDEGKANAGIYLGRVISSNASTRPMFCAEHDKNLFLPIEGDSTLNIENTEHMYLQNWRTFLWEKNSQEYYARNMRKELEKNPQILNQRTIKYLDKGLYIDEEKFNEENKDIVYFALTFTNKTPILASFCEDLSLMSPSGNKGESSNQYFYFQLLHNNNNHCLIVSGFRTPEMEEALKNLKEVYEKDNFEFWQKIFNFMPLKKNVYFNETFAFDNALTTKLKQIYLSNKDMKNQSFMRSLPTIFSKKELFSFFGISRVFTNIP